MPTLAQHRVKYTDNKAFLDQLRGSPISPPEWIAVVVFYCAVHLIEGLAAHDEAGPRHHENHIDRARYLANSEHRSILVNYNRLLAASIVARYADRATFHAHYRTPTVESLITTHLAAIEQHVESYFKRARA